MSDLYNNVKVAIGLTPDIYTADAAAEPGVDTKGFGVGLMIVNCGVVDTADADETYEVKVYECDTSGGTYTDSGLSITVTASDTIQKLAIPNLNTTRKRYLRAYLDVGGTTPSFEGSVEFILGDAASGPVS